MFIRSASSSDASRAAAAALQEADAGETPNSVVEACCCSLFDCHMRHLIGVALPCFHHTLSAQLRPVPRSMHHAGMLPGEGAGGTHPIGSPAGLGLGMRPRRTPRRASWHADQVVMARDGAGHARMDISPPRVHVPSGLDTPKSPQQHLPDYCSPSKKQRKGWTSPAAAPQGGLLPMLRLPMLPRPGSGPSSFLPMLNKPTTGEPLPSRSRGSLVARCTRACSS